MRAATLVMAAVGMDLFGLWASFSNVGHSAHLGGSFTFVIAFFLSVDRTPPGSLGAFYGALYALGKWRGLI